jgi:pimeloyl-ACP methyl ester carboxylesterase
MVLLATFPKTDGSIEFQNEITLKIVDNDKLPDQDKKELLSYQVMSNIFSDYFCRNFKPTLMNLIRENSQRNTVDSYRGAYYMLKDFDATSLLPEIKTPTLIFSALHDRIVETHHSYTLNQLLPNSQRYILKGVSASHTFVMELFETFNDVLLEELKKTKYFQGSRLSVYVENEWVQEKTKEQMLEIHI